MSIVVFRSLVVLFLAMWIGASLIAAFDNSYEVSRVIANTAWTDFSWTVFGTASVAGLVLLFGSSIMLYFFARLGRTMFVLQVFYALAYNLIYGSGNGINILVVLTDIHLLIGGGLVCAIFSTSVKDRFARQVSAK